MLYRPPVLPIRHYHCHHHRYS